MKKIVNWIFFFVYIIVHAVSTLYLIVSFVRIIAQGVTGIAWSYEEWSIFIALLFYCWAMWNVILRRQDAPKIFPFKEGISKY